MTTPLASSAAHPAGSSPPAGTGSAASRILGIAALAAMGLLLWLAFAASPRDALQGDLVRMLYLHPALAWTAYLACFVATAASIQHLRRRTVGSDLLAHSAVELGAVMTALTLVTGSIWGRPTWGVYWVWDARLTSTAILFLLLLGYLALHRIDAAPEVRSRRAAVLGVLLVPNVVLVHQSVEWWRTLHQEPTLARRDFDFGTSDLIMFTMIFGFVALSLVFTWLLLHRFRVGWLEHQVESAWLDEAIEARRAEALAESDRGGAPDADPLGAPAGAAPTAEGPR